MPKGVYQRKGLKVHPSAHLLVHVLAALIIEERTTLGEVAKRSGVAEGTMQKWWNGARSPLLIHIEAALNVFDVTIIPRREK